MQKAILRSYHSVKPLDKESLFAMQTFFAIFILTVMAECIESERNAWMESVLKWFTNDIHPSLISGKGYLDSSVSFKAIAHDAMTMQTRGSVCQ